MTPPRRFITVAGLALGLLVPTFALAGTEARQPPVPEAAPPQLTPSNVRPDAHLAVTVNGAIVSFDASGSTDSDGTLASYEWDLDGDSIYEASTGTQSTIERELPGGTTLLAAVRVRDDDGAADEATAAVAVPLTGPQTPAAADQELVDPAQLAEPEPEPAAAADADAGAAEPATPRKPRKRSTASEPTTRAAASRSVTITDFDFAPTTVNVNVGDTVTWNNRGPTLHTATADNGSFDSGNLNRGQSYSKTFTSAGTFSYLCKPHPFMRGRVVVAGAGGGSGGSGGNGGANSRGAGGGDGSGSSGSGSGGGASGAAASGDTGPTGGLANTGVDLVAWSVFGFALLAFGAAMRLRLTVD